MVRGYFVVAEANVAYAQYLYYWQRRRGKQAQLSSNRVEVGAEAVRHATCPSYGANVCVFVCVCWEKKNGISYGKRMRRGKRNENAVVSPLTQMYNINK